MVLLKKKSGWTETESRNEEHKFKKEGETEKEGWTEGEFDEWEKNGKLTFLAEGSSLNFLHAANLNQHL